VNHSFSTKPAHRRTALAAALAGLCLTAACGTDASHGPATPPGPSSAQTTPAADAGNRLRESFTAAAKSAPWAGQVSGIKLDGRAVIVATSLTKADKVTAKAVCEGALKTAKDTGTDFASVAVRSADDRTLAHQNEAAGQKQCEN